ncbi:MAG: hypothetical protein LBJ84_00510 [Oscillospiraceae bacterium]|nr:hypothetical protein [Oscillospiraceae bacterium]
MKKTKGNEIFKAAMAAVLSIALFSAAFVGVNNLAFAEATNKTESVPSAVTSGYTPVAETELSDGYQNPALTVYEFRDEHHPPAGANAIPFEEAAQIGAKYIWDVLGKSIDGMTVEMAYRTWPSHTTSYWYGTVAETKEDLEMENRDLQYFFIICAISGERKDIVNCKAKTPYPIKESSDAAPKIEIIEITESTGISERGTGVYRITVPSAEPNAEELEEFAKTAEEYAAKHFVGSEVVKVDFDYAGPECYDRDEDGNLITVAHQLQFIVMDSIGREARVTVKQETKELLGISTQYNDVIPGCILNV